MYNTYLHIYVYVFPNIACSLCIMSLLCMCMFQSCPFRIKYPIIVLLLEEDYSSCSQHSLADCSSFCRVVASWSPSHTLLPCMSRCVFFIIHISSSLGIVLKSTYFSCRGLSLGTPTPGNSMPSFGLCSHLTHVRVIRIAHN